VQVLAGFHLFQREPSFGQDLEELRLLIEIAEVSISFRESLLSDKLKMKIWSFGGLRGFHLFQREPSFGLKWKGVARIYVYEFPSLSERAFFRTPNGRKIQKEERRGVSISFRESLLSDTIAIGNPQNTLHPVPGFHLFQREPSFGPGNNENFKNRSNRYRFHLFQREPSFGHGRDDRGGRGRGQKFPSLSERAFFRTT